MRSSNITISFLLAQALLISSAEAAIHYVDVNSTNPVPPYSDWATAATTIQDAENASANGDEILVTNGVYQTGGTSDSRAFISRASFVHSVNGPEATIIKGYQTPGTTNGTGSIRCVSLTYGITLAGFTLTNGASQASGGGVSANTGCVVSNCDIVGNVAYNGGGIFSANCVLYDCRICNNLARAYGGGAFNGQMINCFISNNIAIGTGGGMFQGTNINGVLSGNSAQYGAGAYMVKLVNCIITGNLGSPGPDIPFTSYGGGTYNCGLNNCLLTHNSAFYGGGAYGSYMTNCTVVGNSATFGGGLYLDYATASSFIYVPASTILYYNNAASNGPNCYIVHGGIIDRHCCTTPDYASASDMTNAPLFVDQEKGDFRLSSTSPCVNAGRNSLVANSVDLDGNPRIRGGTVDIGAYEFQNPQSVISYGWLQNHGLPTDGSADFTDSDGDGMNNWQEWVTNTDPTNSLSYLHMLAPDGTNNAAGVTFHWQSAGIRYFLQRSTNLAGPFDTFATNFFAAVGIGTYRDASATNAGPYFYRVGVQP